MILVSGIHGVGKSFFCDCIKEQLNLSYYSASQLITTKRNKVFSVDKHVPDIDDNQPLLIESIEELRQNVGEFILDGHFCLLDADGKITRIPPETYTSLKPDRIILLTERPEIIAERREIRDGIKQDMNDIKAFQDAEKAYAKEISDQLGIPLIISSGSDDIQRIIEWVKKGV